MEERILIVEDESGIRETIKIFLKKEGYKTFMAKDGIEALDILKMEEVDLIIADIMMPRLDGIALLKTLREKEVYTPFIFLSAKSENSDKVNGLDLGADDYITKPFEPSELIARVRSHLRRQNNFKNESEDYVLLKDLKLDLKRKCVLKKEEEISLTNKEYQILELLMTNLGRVFSADEIYERIWKEKPFGTDTIIVHIRRLRQKIEDDPHHPHYIKVVWGIGYKMEED